MVWGPEKSASSSILVACKVSDPNLDMLSWNLYFNKSLRWSVVMVEKTASQLPHLWKTHRRYIQGMGLWQIHSEGQSSRRKREKLPPVCSPQPLVHRHFSCNMESRWRLEGLRRKLRILAVLGLSVNFLWISFLPMLKGPPYLSKGLLAISSSFVRRC